MISLLIAIGLLFQAPVTFQDYGPQLKGVTVGTIYCYFRSQFPAPNQIRVLCYDNGLNVVNTAILVDSKHSHQGYYSSPNTGTITWLFFVSGTQGTNYQLTGDNGFASQPNQPVPYEAGVF